MLSQYGFGYGFNGTYGYGYGYGYDTTPDAFSFTALTDKELGTVYESNTITVSGMNKEATVSITGGEYKIERSVASNGGSFFVETANAIPASTYTSAPGTAYDGDVIRVRLTSSNAYSTTKTATLTVGEGSAAFNVTTKGQTGGGGGGGGSSGGSSGSSGSSSSSTTGTGHTSTGTSSETPKVTITPKSGSGNVVVHSPSGVDVPMIPSCGIVRNGDKVTNAKDMKVYDVRNNWARKFVYRLVKRGVVDNVPKYRPNDNVTRAEFLKMVMSAAGCAPVDPVNVFKDVSSDDWFAPYVSFALKEHVISNQLEYFRPNDSISRAEATKIIVGIFSLNLDASGTTFADVDPTNDLAKYIEASKALGFFDGEMKDGVATFRPNDSITRAEVAKVVASVFNF